MRNVRWTVMVLAAALALGGSGCGRSDSGGDGAAPAGGDPVLAELAGWMTGSFTSEEQAAADSAYYDIRLEMTRIWEERTDAVWLYVEQAAASSLERPYRQRVYRVTSESDGALHSAVFTLEAPLRFAGAWRDPAAFAALTPDSLTERDGCTVVLRRRADGAFAGSTEGSGCASTLRGASYATSEVAVAPDRITSWDRGFDAQGNQVWGATEGAYVFRRRPAGSGEGRR